MLHFVLMTYEKAPVTMRIFPPRIVGGDVDGQSGMVSCRKMQLWSVGSRGKRRRHVGNVCVVCVDGA